jgi:hypothetical protein
MAGRRTGRSVSAGDRIHSFLMKGVAAAVAAYWAEFFTSGRVRTSEDRAYVDFERAFPLADAYMAAAYMAAGLLLSRQRPEAVPVGIAAGSAMVFLGGMDLLYDLEHRKFSERTPEMGFETMLVAFSLVFGPLTMIRMWRARHRLGV